MFVIIITCVLFFFFVELSLTPILKAYSFTFFPEEDKKKETNDGGPEVSSLAVRRMSLEHSKEHGIYLIHTPKLIEMLFVWFTKLKIKC